MTDATREEVLQSLLCCHADLCRMEGRTKDREHDIVAATSRAVSNAIVDLAAPEEEDRDPYNTGMHDEYDLDENGHIKAIHTCENEPEPNLTYAFKEFLRRQISVHKMCKAQGGGKNTICHYCTITDYCDSSVRDVCRELQKEATEDEQWKGKD